ncbi:hypothetical protein DRP53_06595 [candidate division WOR-3 bacterium]|uniref:HD-GYP domain-containing protein n=1 Tax=candidate division WOR-3 bacterium TaxID=2052148 RepID=A0A660SHA7_UNCW3|nr:MAG: hypothetical protein DRP53_06595 [candidate division WOR-3 bacterium]
MIEKELRRRGSKITNLFVVLVKTSRIYDSTNVTYVNSFQAFTSALREYLSEMNRFELQTVYDLLFVSGVRLRIDLEAYINFEFLVEEFKRWDLGEIAFSAGIGDEEIEKFLRIFRSPPKTDPFTFLKETLSREGITNIQVAPPIDVESKLVTEDHRRERAKVAYFSSISAIKEIAHNLRTKQIVGLGRVKRVIYTLVDSLFEDESVLLGLTAIKNFDDYTYNHSVNVSILALAVGNKLGLSKVALGRLGVAAIMHDIGKTLLDRALINSPDGLTDQQWLEMKRHPIFGMERIIELKKLDPTGVLAALVAIQHHINYDLSGYPIAIPGDVLNLFSRLIRIVDSYDAMTTARPYQPIPYLPDLAIKALWRKRETSFDPLLLKLFIRTVGIYPIGTIVRLTSGEIGMVTGVNISALDRPVVKVIIDADGNIVKERIRNLEREPIRVDRSIRPENLGINIADYLL